MNNLEPVLEKVGRTLADRFRIRVLCRGTQCCTDGRNIYLPALPDTIPEDLRRAIRGYLDHEVSHVAYNSDFKLGAAFRQRHGEEAFGLLNCLEDVRVEEAMKRRFPGSAVNLAQAYDYAVSSAQRRVEAGQPPTPFHQLAFGIAARANHRPDLPFIDPEIRAIADDMAKEIAQAADMPDTAAVAKLAESIWSKIDHHFTSSAPPPQSNGGSGNTQASSGSGPSGRPGSPTGSAEGNTQHQTPQGRSRKQRRLQHGTAGNGAAPPFEASPPPAGPGPNENDVGGTGMAQGAAGSASARSGLSAGGIMGGLAQDIAQAVADHAANAQAYRPWSTEHDRVMIAEGKDDGAHASRLAPLMRHVAGVRQKLLQTLLAETLDRWLPDQTEGRLNPRALHRIAGARMLRRDGGAPPSLTNRVFRTRIRAF